MRCAEGMLAVLYAQGKSASCTRLSRACAQLEGVLNFVQDFNIIQYTSVIPAEATEVKYEDVKHTFHHGEGLLSPLGSL